jgi:hypothetical protein
MAEPDQRIASDVVIGNPADAGNVRKFLDGSTRFYTVLRSAAIGFGTYRPGWRWSLHAGPQTGKESMRHIGYIISGRMMVRDSSGKVVEVESGYAFEVGPGGDAWVIGDSPCIALDFVPLNIGAESGE